MAHHVTPGDAVRIVHHMRQTLGGQFEPLATWARDWSAVASCPREHARQQWWGSEWAKVQRRTLLSLAEGRMQPALEHKMAGWAQPGCR